MRVRPNLVANATLLCCLSLFLLACNGGQGQQNFATNSLRPASEQLALSQNIPAKQLGEYSVYLLDAQKKPVANYGWLDCSLDSSTTGDIISVSCTAPPPEDIYLYLTYPGATRRLANLQLDDTRHSEFLLFSIPGRVENVVTIGLARFGSVRNTSAAAGRMLDISFVPGSEQTFKASSLVNVDNLSAPLLEISGSQPGGSVDLTWDERNIGDYNNNSEVEIADITPVAIHFGETPLTTSDPAEFLLIDGDGNGEINLADLTPIAKNYLRTIEGYTVYHAVGDAPAEHEFAPLSTPTVTRSEVWDSADDAARRRRLQYTYHHEAAPATHHYFVRAYAADGSPDTQGLASNTVSQEVIDDNLPPLWDSVEGIRAAVGTTGGVRLVFGSATDPEGGEVEYLLLYTEGSAPIGTLGTVELTIPLDVVAGDAPYTFTVESLTSGQRYNFLLRAYDPDGNGTTNMATTSTTVPMLGVSTDPWAYVRGDIAGTASKPAFMQTDTFEISWQYNLGLDNDSPENQPVVSKDGWIAVAHNDGTIRRLSLDDGSLQSIHPAATGMSAFLPTLDGYTLVVGTATGLAVYDMATTNPPVEINLGHEISAAPLLMGDYVFAVASDGWVFAVLLESGETVWAVDLSSEEGYDLSLASDGAALFVARDYGSLYKFDLYTGAELGSVFVADRIVDNSLAIDTSRGLAYLATRNRQFSVIDTSTMLVSETFDNLRFQDNIVGPCLIPYTDPPLAVAGYFQDSPLYSSFIAAFDLQSGEEVWGLDLDVSFSYLTSISAGADRIYALAEDALYVFDFTGELRQTIPLGDSVQLSSCALADDKLAFVTQNGLQVATPSEENLPPEFGGVNLVNSRHESVEVKWIPAADDFNATVHYAMYISENLPPEFEAPYSHTTVILDPDTGSPSWPGNMYEYLLENLDNGTRYYIGVRAADAPWDENPNIDTNTKWLAVTPPWQRWNYISGMDWVSDEVFTLKGITGGDGLPHLVYTDTTQGYLGHAIWISWDPEWVWERTNLSQHYASAIDLDWDTDLVIGVADIPTGKVGTIARVGPDDWTKQLISPSITFPNPQVSFQYGAENALAYTEHISGVFPPTLEGHYYISTTVDDVWEDPVPLDEDNYSGRDLDLVLDPADNATPWVAYQRGFGYAPDFFTCETGQLMYAKGDGVGGYDLELIDAGDNAPDSDCGKRVRQVVEADGTVHLAYLDLNASPNQPTGQLKYAYNDGTGWEIETVHSFGLDFQTMGLQHTWGEISLTLYSDGTPLIGFLGRISASRNQDIPHTERAYLWVREGVNQWRGELLTDEEYIFPRDREPCVLLVDGEDVIHLFFIATTDEFEPEPRNLAHLWRPSL